MKRLIGLFTVLIFACVVLSASPASSGTPFCWFNKWINECGTWFQAPTVVTAPLGEDVHWRMGITVDLRWVSVDGAIENVVVTDRFGAEIEIEGYAPGDPMPVYSNHGSAAYSVNGESEKVTLTWNIGTLPFGEMAILIFEISTDHNPADHQEYTSPGCYELNSGAVLKFTFDGKQYSAYTLPITVSVAP